MAIIRDELIKDRIKEQRALTPEQTSIEFFPDNKDGIKKAQEKLRKLSDKGAFKRDYNQKTGILQYYSTKKLSDHNLKLLDIRAQFLADGFEIVYFKNKQYNLVIENKKPNFRLIDGYFLLIKEGINFVCYVEIDDYHHTDKEKLDHVCGQLHTNYIRRVRDKEYNNSTEFFIIATAGKDRTKVTEPKDKQIYNCLDYVIEARLLGWNFYNQEIVPTSIAKMIEDKYKINHETLEEKKIRTDKINIENARIAKIQADKLEKDRINLVRIRAENMKRNVIKAKEIKDCIQRRKEDKIREEEEIRKEKYKFKNIMKFIFHIFYVILRFIGRILLDFLDTAAKYLSGH